MLPHQIDAADPKSRHKSILDMEELLRSKGVWTLRPVYIYGPLNSNPVEEWFSQRLAAGRPIPIPSSGLQVTQLGHVKDLADAFVGVLGNETSYEPMYNISGERYVTFDGIAKDAAKVTPLHQNIVTTASDSKTYLTWPSFADAKASALSTLEQGFSPWRP